MAKITSPYDIPFLQEGVNFPTAEQRKRCMEYEENEKLFKGKHRELFEMPKYQKLNPNLKERVRIAVNFPSSTTRAYSDLLFNKMPVMSADDKDWIKTFNKRNRINIEFPKMGDAQSYYGVVPVVIWKSNNKAYFKAIDPKFWFPVESTELVDEFDAHVVGYFESMDEKSASGTLVKTVTVFHATIYFPDFIYFWDFKIIDGTIRKITEREETQVNEIGELLVVPIYNLSMVGDCEGISDYADCKDLFAELDIRLTQYSDILNDHASPSIMGDAKFTEKILDSDGRTVLSQWNKSDYYVVNDDDVKPEYLTWDAKLENADSHIKRIVDFLYLATDTNATLFGIYSNGNIPSGSGIKKLLMRTMARKGRKANQFIYALDKIYNICYKLENGLDAELDIDIKFQDGLPIDAYEQSQIDSRNSAGKSVKSIEKIVEESQGLTGADLKAEVERIKAEWKEASNSSSGDTVALNSMVGDNSDADNGSNSVNHGGQRV